MSQFHKQIGKLLLTKLKEVENPVIVAGSGSNIGKPFDISRHVVPKLNEFFLFSEPPEHRAINSDSRLRWAVSPTT